MGADIFFPTGTGNQGVNVYSGTPIFVPADDYSGAALNPNDINTIVYQIGISGFSGYSGAQGLSGYSGAQMNLLFGSKASAVDAGYLGEISFDDDFLYVCVQAGEAGFAKWKGFFGVVK